MELGGDIESAEGTEQRAASASRRRKENNTSKGLHRSITKVKAVLDDEIQAVVKPYV